MPDSVARNVLSLLKDLRGVEDLKRLVCTELGYAWAGAPLARRSWPEPLRGLLAEDPLLLATAGAEGGFHVLYCRMAAERLSVAQERQVVGELLRRHPCALFVFANRAEDAWHFVNVKIGVPHEGEEHREAGRRRLLRRIAVEPGEPNRTGAERLAEIAAAKLPGGAAASPLAIQEVHDHAFDVEKVTRAFYQKYREVFGQVEALVRGFGEDGDGRRLFTQRLFNRLMFVAFLQKKGWLEFHGDRDYLNALWASYLRQAADEPGESNEFYRDRLQVLFHAVFNGRHNLMPNGGDRLIQRLVGTDLYLNGGLFEPDRLDRVPGLRVPDEAVRLILKELFGRFNFTITEASPLEVEVAVDPEMLGRVFEELVTGRHESGSYYTPKPIVSFMCREALKGYLRTAAPQEAEAAVARFVDDHDAAGLMDGEAVLQALREVKACDPACGSGAYLLGMLHELLGLREALFATRGLDAVSIYDRKLEIIQNNLYGVDVDRFAVDTARLRLWLSLVVDFEREEAGEPVPPLPNLDFKIEEGDSLAAPLERQYHLSDAVVQAYDRAKAGYLRSHEGHKRVARAEVDRLRREIAEWAHAGGQVEGFDWLVEFAEVFAERPAPALPGARQPAPRGGGFDIVMANPPYVRQELIRGQKPRLAANFDQVHAGTADLYVYFYARALEMLAPGGMLVFISSNKWFRAAYGAKLRE
ncbi:MAG: Eco57I restriction-modification methylase domain-containing protein, partial [Longimicrobiaceae bacterium]